MSEGGSSSERFEHDMAEAAKKFDVVQSTETTLLLDLDTAASMAQYARVLPKVQANFPVVTVEQWSSKSGNIHVRITLESPLSFAERLALQAALGSDGVREVLSLKRLLNGCVEPSALFRPKVAVALNA